MALTSKHGYTQIAAALKEVLDGYKHSTYLAHVHGVHTIRDVAVRLANLFARDSRAFDRQRFYKDIGIEDPAPVAGDSYSPERCSDMWHRDSSRGGCPTCGGTRKRPSILMREEEGNANTQ